MKIKTRKLGNQGLEVSSIGLGCMTIINELYGAVDSGTIEKKEGIKLLHHALEIGYTFFDTAEAYGPYTNEELLGEAFVGRRDKIILATKFGFHIENGKMVGMETNSKPSHIKKVVEESLSRLKTDYIDVLYQHRLDPSVPIEEVADTVKNLIKEGKVRFWGLSEVGVAVIRKAHAIQPVSVLQSEYSLWERNLEKDVIPVLKELNIGLVPFSPLGRGLLAGNAKRAEELPDGDIRKNYPRFQGSNFDANTKTIEIVHNMAKAKNITSSQIALAWILAQGEQIVPIPGTKRSKYLEENIKACDVVLSTEDIKALNIALSPENIVGERYPEAFMKSVNR